MRFPQISHREHPMQSHGEGHRSIHSPVSLLVTRLQRNGVVWKPIKPREALRFRPVLVPQIFVLDLAKERMAVFQEVEEGGDLVMVQAFEGLYGLSVTSPAV
ncbi:hypothetical protein Bca4012_027475 [Brassica carinata]